MFSVSLQISIWVCYWFSVRPPLFSWISDWDHGTQTMSAGSCNNKLAISFLEKTAIPKTDWKMKCQDQVIWISERDLSLWWPAFAYFYLFLLYYPYYNVYCYAVFYSPRSFWSPSSYIRNTEMPDAVLFRLLLPSTARWMITEVATTGVSKPNWNTFMWNVEETCSTRLSI